METRGSIKSEQKTKVRENLNVQETVDKDSQQEYIPEELSLMKRVSEYIAKHDYMFRICIVGDANVGKTSLLTRYCDNVFKETYNNTIGVDFRVVTLKFQDSYTKVHIWDTAGQERFKSISVNYFRSTHGFIFLYDVSNRASFLNLNSWIELAFNTNKSSVVNFLIGNKTDLENREVSQEEGKELAARWKFNFLETSAKKNENVEVAFKFFAFKLIKYYSKNKLDYERMSSASLDKLKFEEISKSIDVSQNSKEKCAC
jgi:small GTP-binding protein